MKKGIELFDIFLIVILVCKIIYLYSLVSERVANYTGDKEGFKYFHNLAEFTHNLFYIMMSLLIIYLFKPHFWFPEPVIVEGHTKTFLFFFAILILLGTRYENLIVDWKQLYTFRKNTF